MATKIGAWPALELTDAERTSAAKSISRHRYLDAASGCWVWTGSLFASGYGSVKVRQKRMLAHRISYATHVGAIRAGLTLDHLCRNRACVNPAHLEMVTIGENMLRGDAPPAKNRRKTHCEKGHALTDGNLVRRPAGKRTCLTCHREAMRIVAAKWRSNPENLARHAAQERARRLQMKTKKKTAIKTVTPGTLLRQGDVLLRAVDVAEEKLEPAKPIGPGPGLLLALGETSGHGHYIFGKGARLMQYKQSGGRVVVVADAGADMRVVGGGSGGVDRHTPIALAPGHYQVVIQKSYDAGMARRVED